MLHSFILFHSLTFILFFLVFWGHNDNHQIYQQGCILETWMQVQQIFPTNTSHKEGIWLRQSDATSPCLSYTELAVWRSPVSQTSPRCPPSMRAIPMQRERMWWGPVLTAVCGTAYSCIAKLPAPLQHHLPYRLPLRHRHFSMLFSKEAGLGGRQLARAKTVPRIKQ